MKLIPKDAVVAEIERRKSIAVDRLALEEPQYKNLLRSIIQCYDNLLFFIDSLQEEPVSEDLEKEISRCILDEDMNFDSCARHFANWQKTKDESTTEDLGEYINELSKQFPEVSFAKLSRIAVRVAKWQKIKDSEEIKLIRGLLEDFDKHCDEYHEAGFKHGQEALMKDATDVTVHIDAGGYPYIPQMELYDYDKDMPLAKGGDRYKVILIKEG